MPPSDDFDYDFEIQPQLDKEFTSASIHNITKEAQSKYIRFKYETILWQIQIAAENKRFAVTFPATDVPLELVSWLVQQNFNVIWEVAGTGAHILVKEPSDYIQSQAKTVMVAW